MISARSTLIHVSSIESKNSCIESENSNIESENLSIQYENSSIESEKSKKKSLFVISYLLLQSFYFITLFAVLIVIFYR